MKIKSVFTKFHHLILENDPFLDNKEIIDIINKVKEQNICLQLQKFSLV